MPSPSVPPQDPTAAFAKRLRDIELRLEAQEKGANLRNASISEGLLRLLGGEFRMEQGAIRIIGGILELLGGSGMVVGDDGEVRSDDFAAGVSGWRLGPTQAEFNDLVLRGGIIGNDALSSPVQVGHQSFAETGFGTATSDQDRAGTSILVPDGFTQALVMATVTAGAVNDTAAADFMYLKAVIAGSASREQPFLAGGNNGWASVTTAKATLLTGLSDGATIPLSARVHTQAAGWAANSVNRAYVEAIAVFLR